ncbi:tripartite tricarboxylate transporter TctB family protein [Paenibacillus radicis (ex Xue et al. 2023)]|uniref:Tripartite tricarboxylate transporter TctB family protein n=1 Tax=Paenibacillus radicis (ex Xue et al. 2023) TaxID=2972489 RepID=A0ABT1YL35_9BACL|nr:tripartite tricarboxylate transporter TctB family protein [Paenibacillus radicis (ex Xue et al. 2023)]MCR8633425.1 tripartite tricarboxylate transporter TctB family protein [Paenibacillus radicis (ex Xue et al. 2023)]
MEKNSEIRVEKIRHLDFASSICLFLLSLFIVWESNNIRVNAGGPIYSSPGLLPLFIGSMLMLCSILLFFKTLKHVGISGNIRALGAWFPQFIKNKDVLNMLAGIAIIGIFTFILIPRFPFMLSSFIFLVFLMKIMEAGSYRKIILTAASVSIFIYVLFEIGFNVTLP